MNASAAATPISRPRHCAMISWCSRQIPCPSWLACANNAAFFLSTMVEMCTYVFGRNPSVCDAALAAREVNDGYFVTQGHIPRQRAAAARFGIVWVPADTHDLQTCRVGRDRQCKRRKGARGDGGRALDETATIEVVFRHGPSLAIPLNPATSPPVGAYNLGRNKHDTQDECSHRRHCLSPLHRCRISEHAAI